MNLLEKIVRSPRPAKKGEINYTLFDRFTVAHFFIGIVYALLKFNFGVTIFLAVGWEVIENPLKANFPSLFPHGTADTLQNSLGDILGVMCGWAVVRFLS